MNLSGALAAMRTKLTDNRVWAEVQTYMHGQIIKQFQESAQGGTSRGVRWDYFKEFWYARSNGSIVPIWGGVPWMNNKRRKVKAKLRSKRPGGRKRYKQGDSLMQSTGIMRGALLSDFNVTETQVNLMTPVKYAIYQNAKRPFNYFSEADQSQVASIIARHMK